MNMGYKPNIHFSRLKIAFKTTEDLISSVENIGLIFKIHKFYKHRKMFMHIKIIRLNK